MTASIETAVAHAVRRAAVRATLAPSIHNTQPWRLVLRAGALEICADWRRRLRVLDPRGRQLTISCGCALLNARVALAAGGFRAEVVRFPDPAEPNVFARLTPSTSTHERLPLGALDPVIELRRTNRRRFASDPVPADVVTAAMCAAGSEGTQLLAITRPEHRLATVRLSQQADQLENADPAYRAELRAWTSDEPHRADGVPAAAVLRVDAGSSDGLPLRDLNTHGLGWRPVEIGSSAQQCLLLLGTEEDSPAAWLRAGEALERVLLEITRHGYVASPLTQVIEVATTNAALRRELQLTMYPQVLLRVGRAPTTPAARRRRLVDVLIEAP